MRKATKWYMAVIIVAGLFAGFWSCRQFFFRDSAYWAGSGLSTFLVLLVLWWRQRGQAPELARGHLRQTVAASLWAGVLLVAANAAIILLGGYASAYTWIVVVLYFTTCHSTLIFCGAIGLSRALAGKPFRFPLIGPR